MKRKKGRCVICNIKPADTDDHIPPKCLFALRDRKNLLKLPTCLDCNNHSSKDDEYLRSVLISRADVDENQSTDELRNALMRSLSDPKQPGFQRLYAKSIGVKKVFTTAGLFLGEQPVFTVDYGRLERVLSKVIRGLYYHHTKMRLKMEYSIKIIVEDDLKLQTQSIKNFIKSKILYHIDQTALCEIGKNTFNYKFLLTKEDKYAGAWILRFYGKVHFLGLVLKNQDL
jgi:hypothetical protein